MKETATYEELQKEFKHKADAYSLLVQCPGHGSFDAKYAIVGEGPGQTEVDQSIPFVGHSGRLLWDALRPYRLLRTHFYATNVSKRQLSLAKNSKLPAFASDEWLKWQHLLHWELKQLPNLETIFLLGNAGISALLGLDGIKKYRGSVYEWEGRKVVVTVNPAAILREPKLEIIFKMDASRLSKVINGDHVEHKISTIINPSFTEAVEYLREAAKSKIMPAYDIETIAGETACHGFAIDSHESICINLRTARDNHYDLHEETLLLQEIQSLGDQTAFITQNGNFDATWTGYKDLLQLRNGFDTLLAHHTLYPTLPHDLGFITSQYTTHPYYKDEIGQYREGGNIDTFWNYNGKDTCITFHAAQAMKRELKDRKLDNFFYNHVMRLEPYLVQTTVDGLAIDPKVKAKITAEMIETTTSVELDFQAQARKILNFPETYKPNLNSPKQMKMLFYTHLRLHAPKDAGFDEAQRTKLLNDSRTPMDVQQLILTFNEYAKQYKFLSTYAEQGIDPDDRTRYTFKQQGVSAAPGRLSSSGTLWGTGMNMQNQPKAAYKFYCSDPGTVMFYFDLAQAEARVVAYLADIAQWKEDFERARLNPGVFDAHISLASSMYNIPYDEVPTEDVDDEGHFTIRYKAKRCRHGLNYTMEWPRLAETTGMHPYEAKKSYVLYHKVNPEIKRWWQQIEVLAKRDKKLVSPFGRELPLFGRLDPETFGNRVAFMPQSTIGDKVKQVWYQCHEDDEWDSNKMRMKLNIHDALIGIATPDKVHTALRIAKKYAESPILITDVWGKKTEELIIPADVAISEADEFGLHRWSTLKKVKGFV